MAREGHDGKGKTEWEDALIKHGIMEAPEKRPTRDQQDLENIERMEKLDINETKNLDQLKEEEDEIEELTLKQLRAKRLAELKKKAATHKYGEVKSIDQQTYSNEVTKASETKGLFVVCHLYVYGKEECMKLNQLLEVVAQKFKAVKFVKIISKEAIPNYPDDSCPTVLIYTKGDLFRQIVGLGSFGGHRATPESVEWALSKFGVLETELEEDPLASIAGRTKISRNIKQKTRYDSDESDISD